MSLVWRLALALVVLCREIRAEWPDVVIGSIGDAAHQAEASDHNPDDDDNNPATPEVVNAIDVMVGGSVDVPELVRRILVRPHPNLAYVIFNRTIWHRRNNFRPMPYTGSDPHINHAHISVGTGSDGHRTQPFDDQTQWGVTRMLTLARQKGQTTIYLCDGFRRRPVSGDVELADIREASRVGLLPPLALNGNVFEAIRLDALGALDQPAQLPPAEAEPVDVDALAGKLLAGILAKLTA